MGFFTTTSTNPGLDADGARVVEAMPKDGKGYTAQQIAFLLRSGYNVAVQCAEAACNSGYLRRVDVYDLKMAHPYLYTRVM